MWVPVRSLRVVFSAEPLIFLVIKQASMFIWLTDWPIQCLMALLLCLWLKVGKLLIAQKPVPVAVC